MSEPISQLASLLEGLSSSAVTGTLQRPVRSVSTDSRLVTPEGLFVAVRGQHADGHSFLSEALEKGATTLVVEEIPPQLWPRVHAAQLTVIQVPDSRQALAALASAYYGHPARRLRLVGITGTNGKTTTSYIVESILQAAGHPVGVLGTVSYRLGGRQLPASHTTPDALVLHQLLAQLVEAKGTHAVMEVSSHALAQDRVWGCHFEAAVFTNLSRDHYEYHGSEEAYFAAKARLFQDSSATWHVLNLDSPYGQKLLHMSNARVLTYGLDTAAMLHAEDVSHGMAGIRFTLTTPQGRLAIRSPFVGRHNVSNLLAGIGAALALGIDAEAIQQGIVQLQRVPGRLERVDQGQDFAVFVDYAHTPDALAQVLRFVRAETSGRLITVFGCGGDRDPGKRPLMGQVVTEVSDYTIITSDNPRAEDPQRIIDAIVVGVGPQAAYTTTSDRRQAIEQAIAIARPHDTIVIAGKGHEDYQIIGPQRLHFDDCEVAREALASRR